MYYCLHGAVVFTKHRSGFRIEMSRQVGGILSKTYTFIMKEWITNKGVPPLLRRKRSQYTCKVVENIRWINIIRGRRGLLRKKREWKRRVGERVGGKGRRGEEPLAEDLPWIGGVHRLLPRPLFSLSRLSP